MDHIESVVAHVEGDPGLGSRMALTLETLDASLSPDARCALFLQAAADALRAEHGDEAVREGLASIAPGSVHAWDEVSQGPDAAEVDGRAEWVAWRRGLLIGFLGFLALVIPFAIAMFALEVVVLNPVMP